MSNRMRRNKMHILKNQWVTEQFPTKETKGKFSQEERQFSCFRTGLTSDCSSAQPLKECPKLRMS